MSMQIERPTTYSVFDAVRIRTNGKVAQLAIHLEGERLILHGRTSSFYIKQLAQEAVMEMNAGLDFENQIEVH